jgi:VWFA-related protein
MVGALSPNLVLAQSPDSSQPEIVFKSRSELVTVPVIVTDKFGRHVHFLKKEDFELRQAGAPQRIANFEEVLKPSDIHLSSAVPGQFTNVLTSDPKPVNLTILMVDLLNTSISDQMNANTALTQYLAELGKNPPPTSIFALTGGGLKIIHDFATDSAKLATALESTSPRREGVEPAMQVNLNNDSDPLMRQAFERLAEAEKHRELMDREIAILTTLRAMRQIAQSCAGLPGRKILLWASGGFPFSFSEVGEELKTMRPTTASYSDLASFYEETWKVLNQAQVAVYPVDVRGLTTDALADVETDSPTRGYQHGEWTNSEIIATFKAFAQMTGGLAFYHTNGLKAAFEKAADDNREYYMLSFYLNSHQAKTGWHKLNVRVKRPGVQVRARSGFYVSPNSDQHNDTEIKVALGSPVNYTAVPIVGRWEKIVPAPEKEKGKKTVIFFLTMPANCRD